jgi:hypothetical protein
MVLGRLKDTVDQGVIKVDQDRPLVHHGRVDLLAQANPKTGGAEATWSQHAVSTLDESMNGK